MSFTRPDLLWLAFALPAVVTLGILGFARRRRVVARALGDAGLVRRIGGNELHRFPTRRLALVALAAVAIGTAAAGPRWGTEAVESRSRALNVVLALDVSRSMLARDLTPSRLERERLLATRLLRELRGDRIGLVVFAGRAYTLSPLTVDHAALQLYVDALDPEIVSQGGSSLAAALNQAADLARGEEAIGADRAMILITDGEALEDEAAVIDAAARTARLGVVVHTIALGSAEGAPVPELEPGTGRILGYKRGPDGEVVISRRNDPLLERIGRVAGGRVVRADETGATDRILGDLRGMERATTADGRRAQPKDRSAWMIGLALLALTLDAVLARRGVERRSREAGTADLPALQEVS